MLKRVCLVFGGLSGFSGEKFDHSVIRIPEVSHALREAQEILDTGPLSNTSIDLFSQLHFWDDPSTNSHENNELLCNIIQWGLYQRLQKTLKTEPDFMAGVSNSTSTARLVAGKISFQEMVLNSPFCKMHRTPIPHDSHLRVVPPPLQLTPNFESLVLKEKKYEFLEAQESDLYELLSRLNLDHRLQNFILLGSNARVFNSELNSRKIHEFQLLESIEFDPILSSLWRRSA